MSTSQKRLLRRAVRSIDNDPDGTLAYLAIGVVAGLVVFAFVKGFFF